MQSNKSNGQLTAQINMGEHKKSGFDLSNNVLGTGKIGRIIPTRALHVMPGDTIKADSKVAVQFEPLAVPILANMDVKQEHFYVPYNVVWKNWDKFISGGEKLDYAGVVPNVSVRRMLSVIFNYFGLNSIYAQGYTYVNEDEEPRNGFAFSSTLAFYREAKEKLDTLADTFSIKDLLGVQYQVLEMIRVHDLQDSNFVSRGDFAILTIPDSSVNTDYYRNVFYDRYLEEYGLVGNKYMEEIRPLVLSELEHNSIVLPTDKGFAQLDLMYEYIKTFLGLGSNIDYINMSRITLSEFIMMYVLEFTSQYIHSELPHSDIRLTSSDVPRVANEIPLSILNLRANYNIWYNNYRDILLEANAFEPYDGDNITDDELFVLMVPRQRCWEKDAFTTALDNPGTGNVAVPCTHQPNDDYMNYRRSSVVVKEMNQVHSNDPLGKLAQENDMDIAEVQVGDETYRVPTAFLSGQNPLVQTGNGENVAGFSLHALDAAQRAQKWLQKALYFGNRISDFYYMRFGVRFLDARLRLPELLTSSSELVKLDVIMNNTNITTEANGEVFRSIAGDRAAYASAYDNGNSFDRFCEEHGVIMSYLTIMPQITYAYGINRDYSRLDQFDFAFAEFATLGMDAVYDTEITATSLGQVVGTDHALVFGYQGRYYDYKAKHSEEHGELLDSQDMYTFARKFNMFDPNGRPKLNYEFVHCFPSLDMFVVDSPLADLFRYDIRHSTAAERELPAQSIYI